MERDSGCPGREQGQPVAWDSAEGREVCQRQGILSAEAICRFILAPRFPVGVCGGACLLRMRLRDAPPTFLGVPEPVGVQQGHGNVCPGEGAVGSVHGCGAPGWGVPVVVVCGRGDVVGYRWPGAAAGWYRDETSGLRGSATMCGVTGADHVLVPPFPC